MKEPQYHTNHSNPSRSVIVRGVEEGPELDNQVDCIEQTIHSQHPRDDKQGISNTANFSCDVFIIMKNCYHENRTRKGEKERTRKEKERTRNGEKERTRKGEKERTRKGEKERTRKGEKERTRKGEKERTRKGEKERTRKGEKERPRKGEKERTRKG